jgi:translation initiation factor 1A
MPKKKSKKNKKFREAVERELIFKEDMQEYAKVVKLLGDRRLEIVLADGETTLARIPGKLKRCRVKLDDVILISRRDFQENKVDVIHKYDDKEVKNLITYNEIPSKFACACTDITEEIQSDIIFEENNDEIDFDDI